MIIKTHAGPVDASTPERRKAYATQLLKTAMHYGTEIEIAAITASIESQIGSMLTTRYNPGLNDASYDVYRKFWLKGGEV